jgi:hypothetical protein
MIKHHEVPVHHKAQDHVLEYLEKARIGVDPTVVSPSAIWPKVEPGLHIEFEAAIWVDVLPYQRG